jgi:transcriptional regulator of acetoin/glycerol metabolism
LTYREARDLAMYRITREYLLAVLHHHRGSVTEAARAADLERESLHRLLRRHDIIADAFREPSS